MTQRDVAAVLEEIAILLELSGENPFKARSYENAARQIDQFDGDIETLVRENRLREIKGIGESLDKKITELVTTGTMAYHQELRAKFPDSLFDLFRIPGLGAKRIKALYEELGIRSLGELEYACNENRLITLRGFGPKMQEKVLEGIAFSKRHIGLHLFDEAYEEAQRLRAWLAQDRSVIRLEIAGSLRRRKEVIKDIDILASSNTPAPLMKRFVEAEGVETITAQGDTKSSIVLQSGIPADLRVVSDEQFPYALAYFTGSKAHNVAMRQRAKDRGLKLNEYGLFRGDTLVRCADEAAIFAGLELPFIPPELREDMGEFDVESLPKLVEQQDLIGLYHCHTTYSDGSASIAQIAAAAQERGYRYVVLADHSQSAAYARGLSPEAVLNQHEEVDRLNRKTKGVRIFKGIESDIRTNGALDYDEEVLKRFDLVIASIHSKLDMTEQEATARVIRAVENPYTNLLGHPTGRLLLSRQGYPLDMPKVLDACLANHVAVEINASCHRLDLDWRYLRSAKDRGVKLCIAPDAHSIQAIDDVAYGLGIARKGWLEPRDLLNCMTAEELFTWARQK